MRQRLHALWPLRQGRRVREVALLLIKERFGVDYKLKGVYEPLERLKMRPKVPRPLNPNASIAA